VSVKSRENERATALGDFYGFRVATSDFRVREL
jgi:hypothetical protein